MFLIAGRLWEMVAYERWSHTEVRLYLFLSRANAHVCPFLRTAKSVAEILAYYFSRALLGYITRLSFRPVNKKLGSCSIPFVVHPGKSPGILLCLVASRIYNKFSISTRRKTLFFLVHIGRSPSMLLCLTKRF